MSTDNSQQSVRFPERLRARRHKLGWNQDRLALELHVSPNSISAWERGVNLPNGSTLTALSKKLGVSESWLLGSDHSEEAARLTEKSLEQGGRLGVKTKDPEQASGAEWCKEYFNQFVDKANSRPEHIGWIKTMLRKHFPLSYWDV